MDSNRGHKTPPDKLGVLGPYRAKIDALDRDIIELLRRRYEVIREVGHMKASEGIHPVLQDRVDEVRENAARLAAEKGLDEEFIRHLYAQLIAHSCATEDEIIRAQAPPAKKAAQ